MSLQPLELLLACNQCGSVLSPLTSGTGWFDIDGQSLNSVRKLSACTRCYLARYCNPECQKKHWAQHKVGCQATPSVINDATVNTLVRQYCEAKPGHVAIHLNKDNTFASLEVLSVGLEEGKLKVQAKFEGKTVRAMTYFVSMNFDVNTELRAHLNPAIRVFSPGGAVVLANEMIKSKLYEPAFKMIATKIPERYKNDLYKMFFKQAILLMQEQGVEASRIIACAAMMNKNKEEVLVVIQPPKSIDLPKELQSKIEDAQKLNYGARDLTMGDLAEEVAKLGDFDQAFQLIFDWVREPCVKTIFFRKACALMIPKEITYDKILQLGKKIGFSESVVRRETLGIYVDHDQGDFAEKLASGNEKDLEIVYSAYLNKKDYKKARDLLPSFSPAMRSDMEFFLLGKS